jgi:hypothetical protein
MLPENRDYISQNKIFEYEEVEKSKHQTVFVSEFELSLARVGLRKTAFNNFSENFCFVTVMLKQVCELACEF